MNRDAIVHAGSLPWEPKGATDGDVWVARSDTGARRRDGVPVSGTFVADGSTVLFTAIGDVTLESSVWAYVGLDPVIAAEAAVSDRTNPRVIYGLLTRAFLDADVVLALAENLKITLWSPLTVEGGLVATANRFLSDVLAAVEQDAAPEAVLRCKLAHVSAMTAMQVRV